MNADTELAPIWRATTTDTKGTTQHYASLDGVWYLPIGVRCPDDAHDSLAELFVPGVNGNTSTYYVKWHRSFLDANAATFDDPEVSE